MVAERGGDLLARQLVARDLDLSAGHARRVQQRRGGCRADVVDGDHLQRHPGCQGSTQDDHAVLGLGGKEAVEVLHEERGPHERRLQAQGGDALLHAALALEVGDARVALGAPDRSVHDVRDADVARRLGDQASPARLALRAVAPGEVVIANSAPVPANAARRVSTSSTSASTSSAPAPATATAASARGSRTSARTVAPAFSRARAVRAALLPGRADHRDDARVRLGYRWCLADVVLLVLALRS